MHELQHLAQTGWTFCTSEVVWLEELLKPMQHGQNTAIQKYRGFLATLKMLKHHPDVFKNALLIASLKNLKALDAIHVAIAAHHNCTMFVSSDPHFQHLKVLTPHWIKL